MEQLKKTVLNLKFGTEFMVPKMNKYKLTSSYFFFQFVILTICSLSSEHLHHHWIITDIFLKCLWKCVFTNHEGISTADGVASEFVLPPSFVFAAMPRSQVADACGSPSVVVGQNQRVHNKVHEAEIHSVECTFGQNISELMNSCSSNLFTHNTVSWAPPVQLRLGLG